MFYPSDEKKMYTYSLYAVKDLKIFQEEHCPNISPADNFKKSYEDSKDIL